MNPTRPQYIAAIKDEMIDTCKGTGLLPSVMIAQGCLESADGNSELAHTYNNHFGIKPGLSWKGPTINMPTIEYANHQPHKVNDFFRVYTDFTECAKDHVAMLQRVPAYKLAGLFDAKTPEAQTICLRKAGYATDPGYPQKLMKIINENHLTQYDPES